MSKFTVAALIAVASFTLATNADAQSIHFSGGGIHVDVGNPHGGQHADHDHDHHGHGTQQVAFVTPGRTRTRTRTIYTTNYPGTVYPGTYPATRVRTWQPAHTWHNTSHYDWHPTEYVRHGNHWDVQPGHWDYHQTGHWDHNHP